MNNGDSEWSTVNRMKEKGMKKVKVRQIQMKRTDPFSKLHHYGMNRL